MTCCLKIIFNKELLVNERLVYSVRLFPEGNILRNLESPVKNCPKVSLNVYEFYIILIVIIFIHIVS